jgi:hypothetical protein
MNEIIVVDTNIIISTLISESADSTNTRPKRFTLRRAEIYYRRTFQTRSENSKGDKIFQR